MRIKNQKLIEYNEVLEEKKIAIIGVDYKNVKFIEYLYNIQAEEIVVFDTREIEHINGDLMDKVITRGIEYVLGENCFQELKGFDIIFRGSNYLPTIPEIVEEEKRGAKITSVLELFMEVCPATMIGIAGTDGKLTTSAFIYEILKNAGYNCFIGGDEDTFLLNIIDDIKEEDFVILKFNNNQLLHMNISPNTSIITNLELSDINLEYPLEDYIEALKNIFIHQDRDGLLITNYDNDLLRYFEREAKGKTVFFGEEKIEQGYLISDNKIKFCNGELRIHLLDAKNMNLRGNHNLKNAACAIIATSEFVDLENSLNSIKNLTDIENRLELVLETENRIRWYNDSASIKPSRIITALNSFPIRNIILITGGNIQKDYDYKVLAGPIINSCKVLIINGENTDLIEEQINKQLRFTGNKVEIYKTEKIEDSVEIAKKIAVTGDVIIYSPGTETESIKQRGEDFKKLL